MLTTHREMKTKTSSSSSRDFDNKLQNYSLDRNDLRLMKCVWWRFFVLLGSCEYFVIPPCTTSKMNLNYEEPAVSLQWFFVSKAENCPRCYRLSNMNFHDAFSSLRICRGDEINHREFLRIAYQEKQKLTKELYATVVSNEHERFTPSQFSWAFLKFVFFFNFKLTYKVASAEIFAHWNIKTNVEKAILTTNSRN